MHILFLNLEASVPHRLSLTFAVPAYFINIALLKILCLWAPKNYWGIQKAVVSVSHTNQHQS